MRQVEPFRTRLAYVGERDYISGADLYRSFEHFVAERVPVALRPRHVRVLKLAREVERDGSWHLDAPQAQDAPAPSVSLDYVDSAGARHLATLAEDGPRITDREPQRASRVASMERAGPFSGRAVLVPLRGSVDLVYGLVEVNKALHVATLQERGEPARSIRFLYLEDLPQLGDEQQRSTQIELTHLRAHRAEGRTYTLALVRTSLAPEPMRLCYSYAS